MTKIYTLVDPITEQIRYVGKTEGTIANRLRGHLEKSRNLDNKWHVATWIRYLTAQGLVPIIETIREVEAVYANETERFCIAEYKRLGCDLTNGTEGGDGGVTGPTERRHTAEAIRKRTATRRANGSGGSAWRGKKQPPEVIAARMESYTPEKRREAHRKAKETKARRKAVAAAFGVDLYSMPAYNKGVPLTDAAKENLRLKALEQWANYSEEERARHESRGREALEAFRDRVRSGEIDHPCKGQTPWNKGLDQGPEVGYKSWETKRANGFVSQRSMLEEIAAGCGHTVPKVERALKGYSHKVRADIVEEIWTWYEENKESYPNLTVINPLS